MRFDEITAPAPDVAALEATYHTLVERIEQAAAPADVTAAIADWERTRRLTEQYGSLVGLRFAQNVNDADAKAAQDALDAIRPKLTANDISVMNALLASPHRPALTDTFGETAFRLWECAVTAFDPKIADDLVAESKQVSDVMSLTARGEVEVDGDKMSLSEVVGLLEHEDRDRREAAARAYWGWFKDNGVALDDAFDALVKLRDNMAKKLGFSSYVELGYKLMNRVDYNQQDVERFRAQVRDSLVPLCSKLRAQQAESLGVDQVMYWDEGVFSPAGAAVPQGDLPWMMDRAREMFADLHPDLDHFFGLMADGGYLDLPSRQGKSGGGFCTSFPTAGMPFVFANFNGTSGDVRVFTHEVGHAFQCWKSRDQPLVEYLWPTYEACEIHSMSLEFLTYPSMERFFGDSADQFRRDHLMQSLLFIPYGVAIDHFQHLVYERPEATPAERHAMWQEMERTYLPWRAYGDVPRVGEGAFWQRQMHVFFSPFYYIDYTLAQTCALQFWDKATTDRPAAMEAYVALCALGGSSSFQTLARSAGLTSPFDDGCLDAVVARAAAALA